VPSGTVASATNCAQSQVVAADAAVTADGMMDNIMASNRKVEAIRNREVIASSLK